MKEIISQWVDRYLSEPEAILLLILVIAGIAIVTQLGMILAPVFASLVIAFILEGLVFRLEKCHIKRKIAVILCFILFLSSVVLLFFGIFPLLLRQLSNFFSELPIMLSRLQMVLLQIPQQYPDFLSPDQMDNLIWQIKLTVGKFGQTILSFSLSSIPGVITMGVYLVLVPLLVFFFMFDKNKILTWGSQFLPAKRAAMQQIWKHVNYQLGNYVRGKAIEIIIVGFVTYSLFAVMKLPYAMLLAFLVGLSVIIPFLGIIVVTVPVTIVGLLQWGWSMPFAWLMIFYTAIVTLDANLLVPLLFSEAVNLHPIAIIVAILFFGGLWGFWGVFFAIPLATLIQALMVAWPRKE